MKRLKIPLFLLAQYLGILCASGQTVNTPDTSNYKEHQLKIEEVNLVSGYYNQDGNHSAVTGGIGTEKLTDFANTFELKVSKLNNHNIKHSLSAEFGIDYYTSASSDNIDPNPEIRNGKTIQITGPSRHDTRIYPSLSWTRTDDSKGLTTGAGVSYSHEFDYQSYGGNLTFIKASRDNNREFGVKLAAFLDQWTVIYPIELRPADGSLSGRGPNLVKPRNSFQASFTYSQVMTRRLQMALIFDPSYQAGQLTTLYQRVYFTDNSERVEKLPDTRLKIPIGLRANYFLGDRVVLRAFYRFYHDDWGLTANTFSLEAPVKISPFLSLSPFYRISSQSGINYFETYKNHNPGEEYYTSDYDLSRFTSHFFGMGIRMAPPRGVFGIKEFSSLELRYGHYLRSTDLASDIVTMALKFK